MADFQNKVVIITGASSGIGAATAVEFAKRGAWLSLTGRDKQRLEETASTCQQHGAEKDKIVQTLGDLTDPATLDLIIQNTMDKFGKMNILVNNAGMGIMREFESITMEQVDHEFKVLLIAPFFLSQKALPYLKETKGCIVNISSKSSSSDSVMTHAMSYSMMKAGLDHFTRTLACVAAKSGVRVNCVNPGYTKTPMVGDNNVLEEFAKEAAPLGVVIQPEEIASTIAFLASDTAATITGVCLPHDSGLGVRNVVKDN